MSLRTHNGSDRSFPSTGASRSSRSWWESDEPTLPPWELTTLTLLQLTIVLAGFNLRLLAGVSATLVVAVGLAPLWWSALRTFSLSALIVGLAGIAVPTGFYLAELSRDDHPISRSLQIEHVAQLLNGVAIMVVILWGRLHFPLHRVAALYGLGAVADAVLNTSLSWKFHLAVPMTILVVGWMAKLKNQFVSVIVLVLFGLLGILDEGRSYFAFCIAAAGLAIWQMRPNDGRVSNRWYPAALLAGLSAAIYSVATSLLTSGYFGPELQQRSVDQIDSTGSLIAGGRPEWAATRALIELRPRGYGVGVIPQLADHSAARQGLASINVDTGGYLTNFMLGGQFRLHSVTSDLWARFGIIGIALALTVIFALVRSLSTLAAARRAPTIVIFITILALWHMLFGPFYSNWPDVCFALGLSLLVHPDAEQDMPSAGRRALE